MKETRERICCAAR